MIEGQCYQYPQSFANQLSKLSGKKIINMGIGGNGPLIMLAQIVEYVSFYKPEIVIWTHFDNDVYNLKVEEQFSPFLLKYFYDDSFSQNLINRQEEADDAIRLFTNKRIADMLSEKIVQKEQNKEFLNFNLIPFVKLQKLRPVIFNDYYLYKLYNKVKYYLYKDEVDKKSYELYEKIILKAKNIVNSYGGKIIFVYLPDMITIYPDKDSHYMPGTREQTLLIWEKNELNYIDITDTMTRHVYKPEELFVYGIWGNHYTKFGYKIASEAIYNEKLSD